MRKTIVTIGPRGAGKTTFCQQIVQARPEIVLIERDAILLELFGSTSLSPYTGEHHVGFEEMIRRVKKCLEHDPITMILDTWNGFAQERAAITRQLRSLRVDHIIGWYFITPEDTVVRQYLARERNENSDLSELALGWRADSCRRDYRLYHSQPIELDQGFDAISQINPLQGAVVPYTKLLR